MPLGRICTYLLISMTILINGTLGYPKSMELENRLAECSETLREIMLAPDKSIPADLIKRSTAIIIFPSLLKAGFGLGGQYGKGVILRRNSSDGKWGPPAFVSLIGGSFGWQLGVQSTEMVLLVMNEMNIKSLFRDKLTIGADASIAAGPLGRDASAALEVNRGAGILSYSKAKGLFAGVSIKGSILEPDWEANEQYYGSDVSIVDIFFQGKGRISPAGKRLIQILNRYSA